MVTSTDGVEVVVAEITGDTLRLLAESVLCRDRSQRNACMVCCCTFPLISTAGNCNNDQQISRKSVSQKPVVTRFLVHHEDYSTMNTPRSDGKQVTPAWRVEKKIFATTLLVLSQHAAYPMCKAREGSFLSTQPLVQLPGRHEVGCSLLRDDTKVPVRLKPSLLKPLLAGQKA